MIDKKNKSVKHIPKIQVDFENEENYEDEPRRRKMESTERQLFNLFEERGIQLKFFLKFKCFIFYDN